VDVYFYQSMKAGTPTKLLHSETGFAAAWGWNRLLLATPKQFPAGVNRGVVVKVVNNSYNYPIGYDRNSNSGRSYLDADGMGTFFPYSDVALRALLSSETATQTFSVGGTVTGLEGNGLVLELNCGEEESISGNGAFSFDAELTDGTGYTVTVKAQPGQSNQTCTISQGSGTVTGANVTNIAVNCATEENTLRFARIRTGASVAMATTRVTGECGGQ
jgi:hypothetical protein